MRLSSAWRSEQSIALPPLSGPTARIRCRRVNHGGRGYCGWRQDWIGTLRRSFTTVILWLVLSTIPAGAQTGGTAPDAQDTGVYYVTASTLNVRFEPAGGGKVAKTLERGEKVFVFEMRDGWGRISKPFSGKNFDLPGMVAYWVSMQYLGREKPGAK